jgi:protein TonB
MLVTGDPTYLSLKIAGARFGDQSTWEGFPFPKARRMGGAQAQLVNSTPPAVTQVDSKPRMLNSAQPRYTEDARRNHVLGAVSARLLVGTDGAVKQIAILNALPDGLTEQALRAAYELRFEPAKKNGEPVEWWMPVMIEFNLK